MKKNKTAELFLVLLILIVMSSGILILQNGMEKLHNVKQQSVYVPEKRDLYNNYGLENDQSLSKIKILETQDQVIYTDRIFNINIEWIFFYIFYLFIYLICCISCCR